MIQPTRYGGREIDTAACGRAEQPMNAVDRSFARIGAVAAICGSLTLFVATLLHPMSADPNDAVAAFTEYAADRIWVASHLGQFVGVLLIGIALIALGRMLSGGAAVEVCVRIGAVGVGASVAAAAVLQAVDGVALKVMVDKWAAAPADQRQALFWATYGVRQIEVGAASLTSLLLGLTVCSYAVGLLAATLYPRWLGGFGLLGGVGLIAAAVLNATTGFSAVTMDVSMPSSAALLLWVFLLGVVMWRKRRASLAA